MWYDHKKNIERVLDIYTGVHSIKVTTDKYEEIVDTLHYNKIIISRSDIRDRKIDSIIEI